jgi:hypothetical protein
MFLNGEPEEAGAKFISNWHDAEVLERLSDYTLSLQFPELPDDFSEEEYDKKFLELTLLWLATIRSSMPKFILNARSCWDYAAGILIEHADSDTSDEHFKEFRDKLDEQTGIAALIGAYFMGVPVADLVDTIGGMNGR